MKKLSFILFFILFIFSACDGVKERETITAIRYIEVKKEVPEQKSYATDRDEAFKEEIDAQFEAGKWNDLDSDFLDKNGLEREFEGFKVSGYFDLNALTDGEPCQGVIWFKKFKKINMYIFVDCEGNKTQQIQQIQEK